MTESLLYKKLDLNIENRFVDNKNGTITDNVTGLMWQKETSSKTYKWHEAMRYAERLSLAGYNDWRLPDIRELRSLVDKTKHHPSIDTVFFPDTKSSWHWSSSSYVPTPFFAWAWVVGFFNSSETYYSNKDFNGYVQYVRLV